MITLHQFGPAYGLRTISPFGLKLEAYMRMAGIPYVSDPKGSPFKAPKGKIPYVTLEDGTVMGDSGLIVERLVRDYGDKLDARLTPAERAAAHALRRMTEESLYFVLVYARWVYEPGFAVVKPVFFSFAPAPIGGMIGSIARRKVKSQLLGQGIARHTVDEVWSIGKADVTALSDALGDKPFFFGDAPTSCDASVYGILNNMLEVPTENPMRALARSLPNLTGFCKRITERYFAD